jgi:hypothetical protein
LCSYFPSPFSILLPTRPSFIISFLPLLRYFSCEKLYPSPTLCVLLNAGELFETFCNMKPFSLPPTC